MTRGTPISEKKNTLSLLKVCECWVNIPLHFTSDCAQVVCPARRRQQAAVRRINAEHWLKHHWASSSATASPAFCPVVARWACHCPANCPHDSIQAAHNWELLRSKRHCLVQCVRCAGAGRNRKLLNVCGLAAFCNHLVRCPRRRRHQEPGGRTPRHVHLCTRCPHHRHPNSQRPCACWTFLQHATPRLNEYCMKQFNTQCCTNNCLNNSCTFHDILLGFCRDSSFLDYEIFTNIWSVL